MSLSRSRILLFGGRFLEEHITYTYIYIYGRLLRGGKKQVNLLMLVQVIRVTKARIQFKSKLSLELSSVMSNKG